jgi:Tfp pilus assembly protein PilF/peroxiredoxin
MNIQQYSSNSPDESRPGQISHQPLKLLSLFLICLLCSLFLRTPAVATLEGLYVGAEVPDFTLEDLKGRSLAFKDIKGEKLTMIIFWSTWSRNSEKVLKSAQKLYADYKGKGLAVVAVNADGLEITPDQITTIQTKIDDLRLEYPVLLDQGLTVFHKYGVIALPTTVIVDPDRTIRYELSGFPVVGSGEMIDFIVSHLEGREPAAAVQKKGYQPDKKALRFYNMGENALNSKRMAATAEMWFKKAAEADPKFVQPHISLGRFYLAQNKLEQAREQFNFALQKEPENAVTLCELGLLLVGDGKYEDGSNLMQKAIEVEEYYTPCYYYLGYTYGKEGNLEEAAKIFTRALEINPMDMNIFIYQGRMYEENAKPAEAAESYRKALEIILSHENG